MRGVIKLLMADDEAIEREAMKKILSRGLPGTEVVGEAANGREAISLARELQPDIILMDVKMPGINGIEAVKIIRRAFPNIKFVIVSAYDTFEYAQEVMREGVKDYLLKPAKKEEIIRTLSRVIRENRMEKPGFPEEEPNQGGDNIYSLSEEAKAYIDDHFHESITLEDVAAHVDLSPYYFSKLFKEQNGTSFIEYLTAMRIQQGKELLKKTHLSLKEICFKVGYHDPNYFSRVFKKNTGRTPSEYRVSIKGSQTKDT